jgi:hypothetical protein
MSSEDHRHWIHHRRGRATRGHRHRCHQNSITTRCGLGQGRQAHDRRRGGEYQDESQFYRYTVEGIDYEADRIRLVEKLWRDQRSEIVARYPEGRRVTVAYDPLNHSRAALEPGTSWGAVTKKMIAPLVLGIAGLGLIWVGVSHVRR